MEITNEDFDDLVAEGLVLVDFWAEWCHTCKMMIPILDSIAEDMKDKVRIIKVDVEGSMNISQKCGVMNLPTMILFKDGVEVDRIVGGKPEAQIVEVIERAL